jgi:hypothetical protein
MYGRRVISISFFYAVLLIVCGHVFPPVCAAAVGR